MTRIFWVASSASRPATTQPAVPPLEQGLEVEVSKGNSQGVMVLLGRGRCLPADDKVVDEIIDLADG